MVKLSLMYKNLTKAEPTILHLLYAVSAVQILLLTPYVNSNKRDTGLTKHPALSALAFDSAVPCDTSCVVCTSRSADNLPRLFYLFCYYSMTYTS